MTSERPFAGRSILIVDDSERVRRRLEATYAALGFEVVGSVDNGLDAWRFVEKQQPDLISLDIIMPVMDGIECYRKMSKSFPSIQCLLVSALANDHRVVEAFTDEIESWRFIGKPAQPAELSQAAGMALGMHDIPKVVIDKDETDQTLMNIDIEDDRSEEPELGLKSSEDQFSIKRKAFQ